MKKSFIAGLLLVAAHVGFAQNPKDIIGKWVYADIADKSKMDEEGLQMAQAIFKDFSLNFRPDQTMTLKIMGKEDGGTYAFKDDATITVDGQKGNILTFKISKLSQDELTIALDEAGPFIMKRGQVTADDAVKPVASEPKVSATMAQISGKWQIVDMEKDVRSDKFNELLKGAFLELNKDGTFAMSIMGMDEAGKWQFRDGNTSLQMETVNGVSNWNILAVSSNDLVMRKGTTGAKVTFKK
jgi:hypothetical protein